MREYLARSWIDPRLVGGVSKIHGDGVLAAAPIARGDKLMEFGGEKISGAVAAQGGYREQSVWAIGPDVYLALRWDDPLPSLDENLNHSCDANAWLADEVTLIARRDIAAGEEVTLDQGTWNFDDAQYTWDEAPCGCGAHDCRGRLTDKDWMLAAVQARYRGHFHPLVQALIDARNVAGETAAR